MENETQTFQVIESIMSLIIGASMHIVEENEIKKQLPAIGK